ncbi:MAG: serine hydrolase domain-containing protein [Pseudomonadota bacterium]
MINTVMKIILSILISFLLTVEANAQQLNLDVKQLMRTYKVPVLGYAIINNNKIIEAKTVSINPNINVDNQTIFQAASISKTLTTYAALKLVSENKIKLDQPANDYLKTWKIKPNQYTQKQPVLIRNLMDMTSGLSVSGFPGYQRGLKLPSNIQILNGDKPSNTPKIDVFYTPGSRYFYSGGAFQVLQQVISDVSKKNFNDFMNKQVLQKIGMTNSIYEYPLKNEKLLSRAAIAYTGWDGKEVPGGWHNYACSGAGGMWSTPSDLAKFAINVSQSFRGNPKGFLPKKVATEMLTRQKSTDFGLGVVVAGKGKGLYFRKEGHNYGYHSLIIMFPNTGKGMVIMTNSETGDIVINYLVAYVAHKFNWPYYFPFFDELVKIPNI